MSGFDVFLSILMIIAGVFSGFFAVVRKPRRGRSKIVSLITSLLLIVGGIVCLVFGLPASEFL